MNTGCGKLETYMVLTRLRSVQILALIGLLYMIFMTFDVPFVYMVVSRGTSSVSPQDDAFIVRPQQLNSKEALHENEAIIPRLNEPLFISFDWRSLNNTENDVFSALHKSAFTAFLLGEKLWDDLKSGKMNLDVENESENRTDTSCLDTISVSRAQLMELGNVVVLPCGLTLGSYITVVDKPRLVLKDGDPSVVRSQFMLELIGSKPVDGEEPTMILHYNPRLKGDWSGKPVIEQNTCYRQQWGTSVRCEGWKSKPEEETGEWLN